MAEVSLTDAGFTSERYFRLVDEGLLAPDDRVELLEGVVVAMAPQNAPHAAEIAQIHAALVAALAAAPEAGVHIRSQLPLVAGRSSVPEPDFALVAGRPGDYRDRHPHTAALVIEVADSSLPQDRLTKSRIYAGAGIPEYWIVNLRDDCIEVFRGADRERRVYRDTATARRGEALEPSSLAGARVAVADLLPPLECLG